MARVTAVIDIGSNSARMVVFERTSRFGFQLLKEAKSRVRISENAYANHGELQEAAMARAEAAIGEFVTIAKSYGARKILAVATSAVRDAPNRQEFLSRIKKRFHLEIRVIDGKKEAFFGGIAALNLLPVEDAITVDIGGGSTELALIKNRKIVDTVSFNIGTVRLKELFFDGKTDFRGGLKFVREALKTLPDHFRSTTVVGIGGTLRALAESVMRKERYPLETLHAYRYDLALHKEYLEEILMAPMTDLKRFGFKQERQDVIREGVLIFRSVVREVMAKEVITSGAGVREGVFLNDLLRGTGGVFPAGFNPSIRAVQDQMGVEPKEAAYLRQESQKLFDLLKPLHLVDDHYRWHLGHAATLTLAGQRFHFYKRHLHAFHIAFHSLNYGFTHEDRILIAKILKAQQKKELAKYSPNSALARFLPGAQTIRWLAFLLYLATAVNSNGSRPKVRYRFEKNTLFITADQKLYLTREALQSLRPPLGLKLVLID